MKIICHPSGNDCMASVVSSCRAGAEMGGGAENVDELSLTW